MGQSVWFWIILALLIGIMIGSWLGRFDQPWDWGHFTETLRDLGLWPR